MTQLPPPQRLTSNDSFSSHNSRNKGSKGSFPLIKSGNSSDREATSSSSCRTSSLSPDEHKEATGHDEDVDAYNNPADYDNHSDNVIVRMPSSIEIKMQQCRDDISDELKAAEDHDQDHSSNAAEAVLSVPRAPSEEIVPISAIQCCNLDREEEKAEEEEPEATGQKGTTRKPTTTVIPNSNEQSTTTTTEAVAQPTNEQSTSSATKAVAQPANEKSTPLQRPTRTLEKRQNSSSRRSKNAPTHPPLVTQQSSVVSWDIGDMESAKKDDDASRQRTEAANGTANHSRRLQRKLSLNNGPRSVAFSNVHIREYKVTIGDNPCCSHGPPLALDWEFSDEAQDIPIDVYELHHVLPKQAMKHRARRSLVLNPTERRARLWQAGYSLEDIDKAAKELEREKWRKSLLGNLEPLYRFQEVWVLYVKPVIFSRAKQARALDQQLDRIERKVRAEHNSQWGDFSVASQDVGLGPGGDIQEDLEKPGTSQAVLIEGIANLLEQEKRLKHMPTNSRSMSHSPSRDSSNQNNSNNGGRPSDGDDEYDDDATQSTYGIQVDKKQQDKATEIILCSLRRPHMRAFHASWVSFFMAFFSWFAITPLLSEVKKSLDLTKADIWMSSLFGTAGTIVMRIIMGPLCDVFGARICMACILIAAAIPTAMTGFVQTSAGLSLVRLFIGIGGASFVACQYWTSEMFTREVAGTANAVVAGWGNLGGGVTNLVMGSALFPLFQWFYRGADEDVNGQESDGTMGNDASSELAWRTVFVVPAILSIVTALIIVCYCDDSPKGSYWDRIRAENMIMTTPMDSLRRAVRNWNVWILSLQYACCFGVEVTMTNATALYFHDEFGQTTVSAAAIASVFGFMNLFARGLGGMGSDRFQTLNGVTGRLFWQMFTLILEGVGVGIFAYSESLAGSIVALIFLSCMVQSAEGSTFGIVPYVDRRFTGSVVGIVGSGGNVGAAIFSIFFVYFNYKAAFLLMGLSAVGSAFLCFFMKREKLAVTYAEVAQEVEERNRMGQDMSSSDVNQQPHDKSSTAEETPLQQGSAEKRLDVEQVGVEASV